MKFSSSNSVDGTFNHHHHEHSSEWASAYLTHFIEECSTPGDLTPNPHHARQKPQPRPQSKLQRQLQQLQQPRRRAHTSHNGAKSSPVAAMFALNIHADDEEEERHAKSESDILYTDHEEDYSYTKPRYNVREGRSVVRAGESSAQNSTRRNSDPHKDHHHQEKKRVVRRRSRSCDALSNSIKAMKQQTHSGSSKKGKKARHRRPRRRSTIDDLPPSSLRRVHFVCDDVTGEHSPTPLKSSILRNPSHKTCQSPPTSEVTKTSPSLSSGTKKSKTQVINLPWKDSQGVQGEYTGEVNASIQPHGFGTFTYTSRVGQEKTMQSIWDNGTQVQDAVLVERESQATLFPYKSYRRMKSAPNPIVFNFVWPHFLLAEVAPG